MCILLMKTGHGNALIRPLLTSQHFQKIAARPSCRYLRLRMLRGSGGDVAG